MAKKKVFKNYLTINDISKEIGKSRTSVKYNLDAKNIPQPKLKLTYLKCMGENIKEYTIYLWHRNQLKIITNRYAKIYPGLYKRFRHPITKKKSNIRR